MIPCTRTCSRVAYRIFAGGIKMFPVRSHPLGGGGGVWKHAPLQKFRCFAVAPGPPKLATNKLLNIHEKIINL